MVAMPKNRPETIRTGGGRAVDAVLSRFADAIGADTGLVLLRGDDGRPRALAIWALDGHERVAPWVSGSFLGRALVARVASVDLDAGETGSEQPTGVRAVAAPIIDDQHTVGALYAGFDGSARLGADELRWTADSYARALALCMRPSDGLAAALAASSLDQLTGCLSWTATCETLRAEVERSQRGGHRLSCCFLGLDGFKRVNRDGGHLAGNRVLTAVGPALKAGLRRYDSVGRCGGDEFVIILPETGARAARQVAARAAAAATAAAAAIRDEPVEVSVGLAEWDEVESDQELLDRAEGAMRTAKASGGARVVVNGPRGRFDGLWARRSQVARGRNGGFGRGENGNGNGDRR
jgi:diguanylate cyclase (GGDEF)-like protein